VGAAVLEVDPGAGDEILDRSRDEHLSGRRRSGDARADVHGDPGDLAVGDLALAGVQTGADIEPDLIE
jgi:hypothetical protein